MYKLRVWWCFLKFVFKIIFFFLNKSGWQDVLKKFFKKIKNKKLVWMKEFVLFLKAMSYF